MKSSLKMVVEENFVAASSTSSPVVTKDASLSSPHFFCYSICFEWMVKLFYSWSFLVSLGMLPFAFQLKYCFWYSEKSSSLRLVIVEQVVCKVELCQLLTFERGFVILLGVQVGSSTENAE